MVVSTVIPPVTLGKVHEGVVSLAQVALREGEKGVASLLHSSLAYTELAAM